MHLHVVFWVLLCSQEALFSYKDISKTGLKTHSTSVWLHFNLQWPYFQVGSPSEILRIKTSTYLFGATSQLIITANIYVKLLSQLAFTHRYLIWLYNLLITLESKWHLFLISNFASKKKARRNINPLGSYLKLYAIYSEDKLQRGLSKIFFIGNIISI